jgi:hypothetical protein
MRRLIALPLAALLLAGHASGASRPAPPRLLGVHVSNGSTPFQGDGALLTTVSPNGDGFRDAAHIGFTLTSPATVELDVTQTDTLGSEGAATHVVQRIHRHFAAGDGELVWLPSRNTAPRTYTLRLTATNAAGRTAIGLGAPGASARAPIVRVQGIDAGFPAPSYAPGQQAELEVSTDAHMLTFQVFAYGGGAFPSIRDLRTNGQAMTAAARVDWTAHTSAPAAIRVVRPGDWPSGLYFLRISADDGRVGYAPFVVRPRTLGKHRVLVVLATQTWQAYNFADANGDGWGDSWYVSNRQRFVDVSRPFLDFGLPFRFHDWDLTFLTWLQQTNKQADFISDQDLGSVATGDELARNYDLVVFPGHEEYVTQQELNVVTRFRDLGGNLAFLAANNMFWRVGIDGTLMSKVALWRSLGHPEAALVGAQYVGSNHGAVQKPFVVTGADRAPWLFAGTGLQNGATFGKYGIEIDATTRASPPGTIVLARIPDLLGPGKSAEMTYYETPQGAKVFAAGALNFAASVGQPPVSGLMENLWSRLSVP